MALTIIIRNGVSCGSWYKYTTVPLHLNNFMEVIIIYYQYNLGANIIVSCCLAGYNATQLTHNYWLNCINFYSLIICLSHLCYQFHSTSHAEFNKIQNFFECCYDVVLWNLWSCYCNKWAKNIHSQYLWVHLLDSELFIGSIVKLFGLILLFHLLLVFLICLHNIVYKLLTTIFKCCYSNLSLKKINFSSIIKHSVVSNMWMSNWYSFIVLYLSLIHI